MVLSEFFVIFTFESSWSVAAVLAEIPAMILKITKLFSMLSCKDFFANCVLTLWGEGVVIYSLLYFSPRLKYDYIFGGTAFLLGKNQLNCQDAMAHQTQ